MSVLCEGVPSAKASDAAFICQNQEKYTIISPPSSRSCENAQTMHDMHEMITTKMYLHSSADLLRRSRQEGSANQQKRLRWCVERGHDVAVAVAADVVVVAAADIVAAQSIVGRVPSRVSVLVRRRTSRCCPSKDGRGAGRPDASSM